MKTKKQVLSPLAEQHDELVYTVTRSETLDVASLLTAIEAFSRQHLGVPDGIMVSATARLQLPVEYWHTVYYGDIPLPITLYSPLDTQVPILFPFEMWDDHLIVCFRRDSLYPQGTDKQSDTVTRQKYRK